MMMMPMMMTLGREASLIGLAGCWFLEKKHRDSQ